MFLETEHTTWFCMLKSKDNQNVHVAWVTLSRQKLHIMWCKRGQISYSTSMRVDTTWGQEAWYLLPTFSIRIVQLWTVLDWQQPGWVPANVVAEWPEPPQILKSDVRGRRRREESCHLAGLIQESLFFVCSTKHICPTGIKLSSPRNHAFVSFV